MLPINVYALTRIKKKENIRRLERQMSKRNSYLNVKEWEIQSLKQFLERLSEEMEDAYELCFFYSFVMPKLGKEFDLLRISEYRVVNIELKSGAISDQAVRMQLLKNRYYLTSLGKEIHSYTYISETDRLVKLTNSGRLQEAGWEQLKQSLRQQENCYDRDIEELFKEEQYLISPISNPEYFLRREYFLTSQQNDIKRKILKHIQQNPHGYQGFTGLPGTGKTILLYDIAMRLSRKKKICLLHFGSKAKTLELLDERMKRVDFLYYTEEDEVVIGEKYGAVLVDEGHWMTQEQQKAIRSYVDKENVLLILSYDWEEVIAKEEKAAAGIEEMEKIPGYVRYQLTNKIRINGELSSFICSIMQRKRNHYRGWYPSVQLGYAETEEEAEKLCGYFRSQGYQYIYDPKCGKRQDASDTEIATARSLEYESVVMLVNESFWYDDYGQFRSREGCRDGESVVRNLYHGLNRAKKRIAVVVLRNEPVFESFLSALQSEKRL